MSRPEPTADPAALVIRAREGDTAAYGQLVTATEGLVRAAVRSVTRDRALCDDAVQETYLRAFRSLHTLRDPAALPAWLRRVAISTARNELRRRHGVPVDPLHLAALPAPAAAPVDDDARLRAALHRAIVALPAGERLLCDRYYRGRWTTARLARDAGIGEAAVRKRLQRLRARLRKEMEMTLDPNAGGTSPLSDRIVELLSRPLLVELPENPVGEVWERIVALRSGDEIVDLPEELSHEEIAGLLADVAHDALPGGVHQLSEERLLRFDLSVPMLLAARGRPVGATLLAAGKVYRDDEVDHAHLQAFHQAELLWTGEHVREWSAMDVLSELLDDLLPGLPVRVEEHDFPMYADRGHEVSVCHGEHWVPVAGWARYADRVVTALGLDPQRHIAVGLGLGLERIAALRHGIDDIRRIESSRVGD